MEGAMDAREGDQKGRQQHAEGQHGEKTHARLIEELHEPMSAEENRPANDDLDERGGRDRQRR
jgi:hypothetical protein